MGIYSHLSVTELEALRSKLSASLTDRLTAPTSAGYNGRNVQFQQRISDIRRELESVQAELARRQGGVVRGPIYLV